MRPGMTKLVLPDASEDLATSLHVSREWLQECIDLLRDRPQLIFYGPPGTGKTYIAQKLAEHLAGDNVRLVQFHPSYPTRTSSRATGRPGDGGRSASSSRPARCGRIVDQAEDNPPVAVRPDHRRDQPRQPGEGLRRALLPARVPRRERSTCCTPRRRHGVHAPEEPLLHRHDEHRRPLDRAGRRGDAPPLRLLSLHPSTSRQAGLLRTLARGQGAPDRRRGPARRLNARDRGPDFKIGPSYFMRAAVHESTGLERTWRTSILPLLEEHHYGE